MSYFIKDHSFIFDVFKEFFDKRSVRHKLSLINEMGITDYEKWLQIELLLFLKDHEKIRKVIREFKFELDRRKTGKQYCFVDFLIEKKKSHNDGIGIPIELKQAHSPTNCITKMLEDVRKCNDIKPSKQPTRFFWCLGIYKMEWQNRRYHNSRNK